MQHPGWSEAYDSLMIELVAGLTAGPAFLALLGPAGTGKTWMLQAAAAALRRRGQPVVLVRRGELPFEVFPGTAVLVDEAARMDDGQLARLAAVRGASVVLADLPAFATRLGQLAHPPTIVPLAPLAPKDMPEFAAAWLAARGLPAGALTHPAVARLFDHSGGVPRLVVQLLRAALAMHGDKGAAGIGADAVDEMAALRLGGFDAGAAPPPAVQDVPHTTQEKPGVAQHTPDLADKNPAIADPAAPSEAPGSPPAPPEPALMAPLAGASVQPRRRFRRAARAAVLPALAASLLIAAVLAVQHGRQPAGSRETVVVASDAPPAAAGAGPDAGTPAGRNTPAAQPHSLREPDAAPNALIESQAQPAPAPNVLPGPTPSIGAAAMPGQEPAAAASPGQPTAPAPNPSGPPPAEMPAPAAVPPAATPSMEAAAVPGQEPAATATPGQPTAPAPNPSEPVPPEVPAQPVIPPGPSMEAAAAPGQDPAVTATPGQAASPAPNPSEPAPPEQPAQAAIPPAPDGERLAAVPSISVPTPLAAPPASEPVPAPASEEPEPQSPVQAGGAPGLVLVAHAGDTMPDLYAKVYHGVRPPPYPDVVAANHLPLRPGSMVVFPAPQDGWPAR